MLFNPLGQAYEVFLAIYNNLPPVFLSFVYLWALIFVLLTLFNIIFKMRS